MKVRIDANLCQGHTMCVLACPEVFLVNDEDGHAYVVNEQVTKKFEEAIRLAAKSCPERAIQVIEE